jgi:DNA-binding transcriptional LysR family regulator
MDSMDLIRTFVHVVKQNGFARAARLLDVAPSVVSKRIAELERNLACSCCCVQHEGSAFPTMGRATSIELRIWCSASTVVSKRIAELERNLGVQLLLRTTRRIRLSDYGARYFNRAADLVQRFDELAKDAARHGDDTGGLIRIASPTSIGIRYIGQISNCSAPRNRACVSIWC